MIQNRGDRASSTTSAELSGHLPSLPSSKISSWSEPELSHQFSTEVLVLAGMLQNRHDDHRNHHGGDGNRRL
ncbi:MAG: hypothetical protein DSY81_09170 [Bacillota bacterium]|nr:MAG: hypothetical protein DSY92_02565 [Planctomycetota bacterium]RUA08581.1 MAG: hypothetical protein DSY81_09170 [Bacillota bacterium]